MGSRVSTTVPSAGPAPGDVAEPDAASGGDAQVLAEARDVVRREAAGLLAVADQLDGSFLEVVRLLLACRGKVFVTGAGTSGAVARRMSHLLSVCGTPAVHVSAMDALHGTMGALTEGDVLIAISRGGGSAEINEFVRRAAQIGVRTVAVTANDVSPLTEAADVVVVLTSPPDVDPGEVIAMGSTLTVAVWGDALAYVLMRLRGYGWQQVLHSHPGGAVGQVQDAPVPLEPLTLDDDATWSARPRAREV